jgi:hypothetical protein
MRPIIAAAAVAVLGLCAGLATGLLTTRQRETVTTTVVEALNNPHEGTGYAPLPTLLEGAFDPRDLGLWSAVPVDANLETAAYVVQAPRQLVVTWDRRDRRGIAVWQLDTPETATWHRVYTREAKYNAYSATLGDVSGDGRPEILVHLDTDGSAGNGSYHLLLSSRSRLREIYARRLSFDEGRILLGRDALIVREGVDHYGTAIHCCWRKVRETRYRWNGRRLLVVCRALTKWGAPLRTCRAHG